MDPGFGNKVGIKERMCTICMKPVKIDEERYAIAKLTPGDYLQQGQFQNFHVLCLDEAAGNDFFEVNE